MFKKYSLIFCVLLGTMLRASESAHPTDDELCEQYAAPPELETLLNRAYMEQNDFRACIHGDNNQPVCKCPYDLPCYIKTNEIMRRVSNHARIKREIIEKHNLTDIMLPEKYLATIGPKECLIAEALEPRKNHYSDPLGGITKEQLMQLIILTKEGNFWDFNGGFYPNIFFSYDRPGKEFLVPNFAPQQYNEPKMAVIDTKRFPDYPTLFRINHSEIASLNGFFRKMFHGTPCDYDIIRDNKELDKNGFPYNIDTFWEKYSQCFSKRSHS